MARPLGIIEGKRCTHRSSCKTRRSEPARPIALPAATKLYLGARLIQRDLETSVVDEMIRFCRSAVRGSAGVLVWVHGVDADQLPSARSNRVFGSLGLTDDYFSRYRLAESFDPLSMNNLLSRRKAVSCLSDGGWTDEEVLNAYRGFLGDCGFNDEIDFLISSCNEPVAILTCMRGDGSSFRDLSLDQQALHRYLEYTFGFHPRVRELRTISQLRQKFGLTDREVEVVFLVRNAATNADISEALNIELSTVKTHVINILNKMGADNRTQIASLTVNI